MLYSQTLPSSVSMQDTFDALKLLGCPLVPTYSRSQTRTTLDKVVFQGIPAVITDLDRKPFDLGAYLETLHGTDVLLPFDLICSPFSTRGRGPRSVGYPRCNHHSFCRGFCKRPCQTPYASFFPAITTIYQRLDSLALSRLWRMVS